MRFRILLLAVFAPACAGLPEASPRPPEPATAAAVARATEAVERGRPDAEALVSALLAGDPGSVDGRRLRQNLRFARGEDYEIYLDARAEAEARPDDAAATYLLGRTIPDRGEQARLFSRALRQDPSSYHAAYGLAAALLGSGRSADAVEFARRALRVRPADPEARMLLAAALSAGGRAEEAAREWDALRREAPGSARVAAGAGRFAARWGRAGEAAAWLLRALSEDPPSVLALGALHAVLRDGVPSEASLAASVALPGRAAAPVRARAALARGDGRVAWREIRGGRGTAPSMASEFEEAFAAAVLAGEYAAARTQFREHVRCLAEGAEDEASAARDALLGALAAASGRADAAALTALARGLRACGFADLSAVACGRALCLAPEDAEAAALAADIAAWREFVRRTRETLERGYRVALAGGRAPGLEEVLGRLRAQSLRLLGCDAFEGAETLGVPGAGCIVRTDRAPVFRERGTLFFLGQRAGGPVEGRAMRLLALVRDGEVEGVPYDLAVGDGRLVVSAQEWQGQAIAGFTTPGFVTLDVGVAGRWAEEIDALRAAEERPVWRSEREEDRRALWFPGGLPGALARQSRIAGRGAVLRAILRHEEGHVLDAARFFPILPNLPAVLWEVVSSGFSPAAIEEGLEVRAESFGLRHAEDCRFSLLFTLAFPAGASPTRAPHPAAYRGLLERIVAEAGASAGRHAAMDPSGNILQQLGRLTEAELADLLDRALE